MNERAIEVQAIYDFHYAGEQTILKFRLHPEWEISYVWPEMLDYQDSTIRIPINGEGRYRIEIKYRGKPRVALNPPWDGGFVWKKDPNGLNWLGVAIQNLGASAWWPEPVWNCPEPNITQVMCTYPERLKFIGNGTLIADAQDNQGNRITTWQINHPINAYNVTINIGDYVHFSDTLYRANSKLPLDFYIIRPDKERAQTHFKTRVKPMLECFESAFGPYPFEKDGYAIVQSAYAGMEHQSAIAYGNGFIDGYRGEDYSGVGIMFDFILVHETGHEWWGNSVTAKNKEDFWIQEAFCTYAEVIYVNCMFGEEASYKYIKAKEGLVKNEIPIMPGSKGGTDMYTKGALMLNTLRTLVNNDTLWFRTIKKLALDYAYSCISTKELIAFLSEEFTMNLQPFFHQYLYQATPPTLIIKPLNNNSGKQMYKLHLENGSVDFYLPLVIVRNGKNELHKVNNKGVELEISSFDYIQSHYSYFTSDSPKIR